MTNLVQLQALMLGGSDGGILQDGAATDLECHLIQVTSDAVFTVLSGVDKDGNAVNMLTTNNLSGKTVSAPAVIGAPDIHAGGYISAITLTSGQILRHTKPNTQRG